MSALTDSLEQIWDAQLDCYDADVVTLTIGAADPADFACDGSELRKSNQVEIGGVFDMPTAQVAVKVSLLTAEPIIGSPAVYRGKNLKVKDCRTSSDNTVLIIDLEPRR